MRQPEREYQFGVIRAMAPSSERRSTRSTRTTRMRFSYGPDSGSVGSVPRRTWRNVRLMNQIKFGRVLDRDIARFRPAQNLIDILRNSQPPPGTGPGSLVRRTSDLPLPRIHEGRASSVPARPPPSEEMSVLTFRNFYGVCTDICATKSYVYTLREAQISIGYKPPAPEVFVPAFATWPAALRRPAPPATLAQRPTLN